MTRCAARRTCAAAVSLYNIANSGLSRAVHCEVLGPRGHLTHTDDAEPFRELLEQFVTHLPHTSSSLESTFSFAAVNTSGSGEVGSDQ
jgi:hypothetical protein